MAQLVQHQRHVDALAAGVGIALGGAVHIAQAQLTEPDNVVQSRIHGNSVNHQDFPLWMGLAAHHLHKQITDTKNIFLTIA